MRDLLIPLQKSDQPKYQVLADSVRSAIKVGRIKPGEVLPSTRDLARRFKMNRHTVMAALAELTSEGWIIAEPKKAYVVTETLPDTFLRPKMLVQKSVSKKSPSYRIARQVDIPEFTPYAGYKHGFPSGCPDLRLFPMREFKSHLYDALKSKTVLQYGDPCGHEGLIHEIQAYLRRTRSVDDSRSVIVTNGSQEAIFLLAQLFIKPGDAVAVEALGYPPAFEALRFAGAKLVPIRVDEEGIDTEDLEEKLKRHKIPLLYLTPLHQYPTTVTLSASRRLHLYELALKHGMFILEDDYDHEFHYVSQPVAPLASFDPAGIVFYVSTFSKILFPSSRIGFMAVPKEVGKHVAKLKRISSRQNEQILQETIAGWMRSGGFERHLRRMRRAYEERRNGLLTVLRESEAAKHGRISWTDPDGGMALWLNIFQDAFAFAEKAKRNSIFVNTERTYRLDGKAGTHVRLGFTGQTPQENRAGLQALLSSL